MQQAVNLDSATTPVSNLRFLEYSIPVDNVLHSMQFFQELGFKSLITNDIRSYPYAVITDGRCFIGLHQSNEFNKLGQQPRFSFVHDDIAPIVRHLNDNNFELINSHLDEDQFQQTFFHGPNNSVINILAARTFSLPSSHERKNSFLGHFKGFVIPTANVDKSASFWESLELLVLPLPDEQTVSISANRLNMLLVENSNHRLPGIFFEHVQPEALFPLFARLGLTLEVGDSDMVLGSEYRFKSPDGLCIWIKRLE